MADGEYNTVRIFAAHCVQEAVKGYTHNDQSSDALITATEAYLTAVLLNHAYGDKIQTGDPALYVQVQRAVDAMAIGTETAKIIKQRLGDRIDEQVKNLTGESQGQER